MTLYGDGQQTRSLCYVDDLVEGLLAVMESPRARGEVINLGNPQERTVKEIAGIIRTLVGSQSTFVHTPPAVGDDPQRRRPNIDKARYLVGWEPHTPLEDGLRAMISAVRVALGETNGHHAPSATNGATHGHANGTHAEANGNGNGSLGTLGNLGSLGSPGSKNGSPAPAPSRLPQP
jgi:hypothetical protein